MDSTRLRRRALHRKEPRHRRRHAGCERRGRPVLFAGSSRRKAWFDEQADKGLDAPAGPYTVAQACDAYLADYQHRQGKDATGTKNQLDRIKAVFGPIEVRKLTATQIKDWHRELGEKGGLTSNRTLDENGERRRRTIDPNDKAARRRRQATANRVLTVLKAALNLAFKSQEELGVSIPSKVAWQSALPTREVDNGIIRYLHDEEATRLLNACKGGFRDLVAAALLTGARYGELSRFRVRDFDAKAAAISVETSKSWKPRSIALTDEGVAHFSRLALGKAGDDLLLVRDNGEPWKPVWQTRPMAAACLAANITPAISFHILRHTYGSRLAMRGAPMAVIAAQLGHADTRMTEKHYAHLAPSYVSDVVRGLLGTFGVPVGDTNVVAMGTSTRAS